MNRIPGLILFFALGPAVIAQTRVNPNQISPPTTSGTQINSANQVSPPVTGQTRINSGGQIQNTVIPSPEASSVLVIVNDATPPQSGTQGKAASQFVADYYMQKRGIPAGNIVHTSTPMMCCASDPNAWDSWHIAWSDFVTQIRTPIKAFLSQNALTTKIKYIVPTYGVPSHIKVDVLGFSSNSVDAFLSQMFFPDPLNQGFADAGQFNPLYKTTAHWDNLALSWPVYAVVRLDGSSALAATGLVDRAIAAEKGIARSSGTGYFDWRHLGGTQDAYWVADQTMTNVYNLCVAAGLTCSLNDQLTTGGMITSAPNALWAWGWYSGSHVNDVYTFVPGAVGAQLTSYTAGCIRGPCDGAWVPLWLGEGITATWGTTGEPGAQFYAWGDILLDRMWHGFNFGEASIFSMEKLGWMMVFVGDPLYKPVFK